MVEKKVLFFFQKKWKSPIDPKIIEIKRYISRHITVKSQKTKKGFIFFKAFKKEFRE